MSYMMGHSKWVYIYVTYTRMMDTVNGYIYNIYLYDEYSMCNMYLYDGHVSSTRLHTDNHVVAAGCKHVRCVAGSCRLPCYALGHTAVHVVGTHNLGKYVWSSLGLERSYHQNLQEMFGHHQV